MLMGAAEGEKKLTEPVQKTVFIEDLTPEEKAKILKEKTGVKNLKINFILKKLYFKDCVAHGIGKLRKHLLLNLIHSVFKKN